MPIVPPPSSYITAKPLGLDPTTSASSTPSCSPRTASATADVPLVGGCERGADGRPAHAPGDVQALGGAPAHGILRRADGLRRHALLARAPRTQRGRAAHVLVRGRTPAGRDRATLQDAFRMRHHRRHRLDDAHLSRPARRRAPRRPAAPTGYERTSGRSRPRRCEQQRDRRPVHQGCPAPLMLVQSWSRRSRARGRRAATVRATRTAIHVRRAQQGGMLEVSGIYVCAVRGRRSTLMLHPAVLECAVIDARRRRADERRPSCVLKAARPSTRRHSRPSSRNNKRLNENPRLNPVRGGLPKTATRKDPALTSCANASVRPSEQGRRDRVAEPTAAPRGRARRRSRVAASGSRLPARRPRFGGDVEGFPGRLLRRQRPCGPDVLALRLRPLDVEAAPRALGARLHA